MGLSLKNVLPLALIGGPIVVVGLLAITAFQSEAEKGKEPDPNLLAPPGLDQASWDTLRPMLDQMPEMMRIRRKGYQASDGNVIAIDLEGPDFTDGRMQDISKLPELKSIRLVALEITDAILESMKDLHKLESLTIRIDRRGDGVKHLEGLSGLTVLNLSNSKGLVDADFESIGKLTNLRILNLMGCAGITDSGLRHLSGLTKLEQFELSGCPEVTDAGLTVFSSMPALKLVSLQGASIVGPGLSNFSASTALENLMLNGTKIDDAGLANLAGCKSLKALHLNNTHVQGIGCGALAELPQLEMLLLIGSSVNDAGISGIVSIKSLETLYLDQTAITGAGFAQLAKLPKLNDLRVAGCRELKDADMASLREFPALTRLSLEGCLLTTAAFPHIRPVARLKEVGLHGNSMVEADVAKLREQMPGTGIVF